MTCQNVFKQCSLPVNNNKATLIIHYKGEILLHITSSMVISITGNLLFLFAFFGDMTIKLGPSTIPITKIFTTELHVCKQQHTPTAN